MRFPCAQDVYKRQPYDLDGRPPLKLAIPLGLQHVLAMFVGNLTPVSYTHLDVYKRQM